MIFLLRLIISFFLIILGFHLSLRSKKGRSTDGSEHLFDDLYMIVLALFSVGVLWIQGVQLVFVHPLDDSGVMGYLIGILLVYVARHEWHKFKQR